MKERPITLEQAKAKYVHRFTLEHVPAWAKDPRRDGTFYAPQYRSDKEWFDNTLFPEDERGKPARERMAIKGACYSSNQTWPLGQSLESVYVVGMDRKPAKPLTYAQTQIAQIPADSLTVSIQLAGFEGERTLWLGINDLEAIDALREFLTARERALKAREEVENEP